MAMSSFNTYQITQLNSEISVLKSKTNLLLDVSHLHEAHLHYLEEKTDATNKLLRDTLKTNIWFTSNITDAIKEKFQTFNTMRTWSNQLNITVWHQEHFPTMSSMKS